MTTPTNISRKLAVLAAMGSLLLSFTTLAFAESDAVRAIYLSAANVPTNLANIHTYAEPPKGFNPLTATDVELATYGFPQRPDKQADPDHYAMWQRAMAAAKIRWHGDLKLAPSSGHGMMIPAGSSHAQPVEQTQAQPQAGPIQLSNISGSGVILDNGVKKWNDKTSFNDIWTEISVPVSQLPFDNTTGCTASDYFSLSLAGIDGEVIGGPPFFIPKENAGVLSAVDCSNSAVYWAYVGWEESWSTVFQVYPGDVFYTELHAFGGCNNSSAFVEDLTTLTYNSYTIASGCGQIGRFANWVVWRPCCDGPGPDGAWPLANTIGISFEGATVMNGSGKLFYPGSQAASTEILTMTDDAGDQPIEVVSQGSTGFQGQHSLFLQTTGCAFTGGCTP